MNSAAAIKQTRLWQVLKDGELFCNLLFVLFSAQKRLFFYVDDRFSLVYVLVLLVWFLCVLFCTGHADGGWYGATIVDVPGIPSGMSRVWSNVFIGSIWTEWLEIYASSVTVWRLRCIKWSFDVYFWSKILFELVFFRHFVLFVTWGKLLAHSRCSNQSVWQIKFYVYL